MLDDLKYIHDRDGSDLLGAANERWAPTVPTKSNLAKQIALDCIGKSVVVYGSKSLQPAVQSWKTDINRIAKQIAWCGQQTDSEALAWRWPLDKLYTIIELQPSIEQKVSGQRPEPIVVQTPDLAWARSLGYAVAVYIAILNGAKL